MFNSGILCEGARLSSDSSDSSDSGSDSSDSCTKAGLSHLQDALNDTTTSRDSPCMHQDPTPLLISGTSIGFMQSALSSEGDNVARCSGAEPSNANISFPEHFEGKRQSGEMYQKDCLPLLSTFCKFQRLKVKGSQVMLVCLHQRSRSGNVDDDRTPTMCWLSSDSATPLWRPHTFVYDCAQLHPW